LEKFIKIFKPSVITLSNDINGNHIIQKFILTVKYPKNQFVYDIINRNILEVGFNKHGCCVLQKCIESGTEEQKRVLIRSTVEHAKQFLVDQYGNYVMQNIISLKDYQINKIISEAFIDDIFNLSKEKYSSNVIEKCLDHCDEETQLSIVKELANPEIIPALLIDMYGNYVIQKALLVAKEPFYSIFIYNIAPVLKKIKNVPFGAKLYNKFVNSYPELNFLLSNNNQQNGNGKDQSPKGYSTDATLNGNGVNERQNLNNNNQWGYKSYY